MRIIPLIVVCLFSVLICRAQKVSQMVESITFNHFRLLRNTKIEPIYKLLFNSRGRNEIDKRMDTIAYRFAYIEERYNSLDSLINTAEYYFNVEPKGLYPNNFEDKDTLADCVFMNGKQIDQRYMYYGRAIAGVVFSGKHEYYHTIENIKLRCKHMLPVQEISYDNTPEIPNFTSSKKYMGIDTSSAAKLDAEMKHIGMLKSSYQIVIFIDKQNNKLQVSLQKPTIAPKINSYPFIFRDLDW